MSRKKSDLLRNQNKPKVFGYELDTKTLSVVRKPVNTSISGDYGANPIGDGTFRMIPSGDIVDYAERCKRLEKKVI